MRLSCLVVSDDHFVRIYRTQHQINVVRAMVRRLAASLAYISGDLTTNGDLDPAPLFEQLSKNNGLERVRHADASLLREHRESNRAPVRGILFAIID